MKHNFVIVLDKRPSRNKSLLGFISLFLVEILFADYFTIKEKLNVFKNKFRKYEIAKKFAIQ